MKITGGLYLVINPKMGKQRVLFQLEEALKGGVDVVQLLNSWSNDEVAEELISDACKLVHSYDKPILVQEEWWWLNKIPQLDGVHLDGRIEQWKKIKDEIKRPFITGMTCTNDLSSIHWAVQESFDYLSFCSLYPTPSAINCELVDPEIIRTTRGITSIPIFGAGGIRPNDVSTVLELGLNGVAILSAIMDAEDPRIETEKFKKALQRNPTIL